MYPGRAVIFVPTFQKSEIDCEKIGENNFGDFDALYQLPESRTTMYLSTIMVKIEPSNLSFTCTVVYPVETSVFFVCAERPKKSFKTPY